MQEVDLTLRLYPSAFPLTFNHHVTPKIKKQKPLLSEISINYLTLPDVPLDLNLYIIPPVHTIDSIPTENETHDSLPVKRISITPELKQSKKQKTETQNDLSISQYSKVNQLTNSNSTFNNFEISEKNFLETFSSSEKDNDSLAKDSNTHTEQNRSEAKGLDELETVDNERINNKESRSNRIEGSPTKLKEQISDRTTIESYIRDNDKRIQHTLNSLYIWMKEKLSIKGPSRITKDFLTLGKFRAKPSNFTHKELDIVRFYRHLPYHCCCELLEILFGLPFDIIKQELQVFDVTITPIADEITSPINLTSVPVNVNDHLIAVNNVQEQDQSSSNADGNILVPADNIAPPPQLIEPINGAVESRCDSISDDIIIEPKDQSNNNHNENIISNVNVNNEPVNSKQMPFVNMIEDKEIVPEGQQMIDRFPVISTNNNNNNNNNDIALNNSSMGNTISNNTIDLADNITNNDVKIADSTLYDQDMEIDTDTSNTTSQPPHKPPTNTQQPPTSIDLPQSEAAPSPNKSNDDLPLSSTFNLPSIDRKKFHVDFHSFPNTISDPIKWFTLWPKILKLVDNSVLSNYLNNTFYSSYWSEIRRIRSSSYVFLDINDKKLIELLLSNYDLNLFLVILIVSAITSVRTNLVKNYVFHYLHVRFIHHVEKLNSFDDSMLWKLLSSHTPSFLLEFSQQVSYHTPNNTFHPEISVVNTVDGASLPTIQWLFEKFICFRAIKIEEPHYPVCDCKSVCTSACPCFTPLSSLDLTQPLELFECSICKCKFPCPNRSLFDKEFHGLQIIRLPSRCWGVRTLENIPKFTFVCLLLGEVVESPHPDKTTFSPYRKPPHVSVKTYGNISKFIRHSSNSNLVLVKVWKQAVDRIPYPRLVFIASRDINKFEELFFDHSLHQF